MIISDDWVAPPFIPWDTFSIRVKESQLDDLPRMLADKPYEELGRRAREAWEQFVDRPHALHYLAESIQLIPNEKNQGVSRRNPYAALMASDLKKPLCAKQAEVRQRKLKSLLKM
ncbi:MAG: hypothetical protein ABIQ82_12360 [Variovorax sp.]